MPREMRPDIEPPQPDNFYYGALRLRAEERFSQHPDPVAAGFAELTDFPCIAMPPAHALTCSQSVLFLAAQLTKGKADTAHSLLLRVGNLTVPQMRRTLERMGLAHFPIYVLVPEQAPLPEDYYPQFIQARGSKHREDNWAMLYIAATQFMAAHWTFTQISPPVERPVEERQTRTIIYTHLPWKPVATQFWRCKLTKNNQRSYLAAVAEGRACCCNLDLFCTHEKTFLEENADAVRVSLLDNHYVDGSDRGQLDCTTTTKHAGNRIVVVQCDSQVERLNAGHHCESVLDIGKMVSPFSMLSNALFHRSIEPWKWIDAESETAIEIPTHVSKVVAGDLRITAFRYEPRYGIFGAMQIVGSLATSALLIMREFNRYVRAPVKLTKVSVSLKPYAHRTNFLQHYVSKIESGVTSVYTSIVHSIQKLWCSVTNVQILPKIPETTLQRVYRYTYEHVERISMVIAPKLLTLSVVCSALTLFYFSFRALTIRLRRTRLIPVVPVPMDVPYGYVEDLNTTLPAPVEIGARLACLPSVTRDHAYDLLRRVSAEHGWLHTYDRHEIEAWIERVVTEPGFTRLPADAPGMCLNCKAMPMKYRFLCKPCWARLRNTPVLDALYINDQMIVYNGVLPIWSSRFQFPAQRMKKSAVVFIGSKGNKRVLFDHHTEPAEMQAWYERQHVVTTYRGRSCGPTFMGQRPTCFPRGHETAVVAFLVRLGGVTSCQPDNTWIDHLIHYFQLEQTPKIEPESRSVFLSHFKAEKLQKMLDAERNIANGNYKPPKSGDPKCKMSGFTKAEKSYWFTFLFYLFMAKAEVKPRFICCPSPEFLFEIGPYTHAQTKWLGRQYTWQDHLFYAGCATPQELNAWLNFTLMQLGSFVTIADDITACDSSHSEATMRFHTAARKKLFHQISDYIETHYLAEHRLRIRVGKYKLHVDFVNGSGVSDTSFKNSLLCLFIRLFAIAHAVRDLTTFRTQAELFEFIESVRVQIYTSASGDDGLTRSLRYLYGVDIISEAAIQRYVQMWAWFGFSVKVQVYPETQWRLATYLAMRPTWTGRFYEWTPEPARRLRGLFWQIDNNMHPVVWARSVATGLAAIASSNPILGPIAQWFLDNTQGPVVPTQIFDNPYSVWHDYQLEGVSITQRAISEMLLDYELMPRDYDIFLGLLRQTGSVYVDFNCRLIHQLYRLES